MSSARWPFKYVVIGVVAALAITVGLATRVRADNAVANLSATDRVKAHTPPMLFSDAQINTIAPAIDSEQTQSSSAMADWWATHGSAVDDKAFLLWAESRVPAPPDASTRAQEMTEVAALKSVRSAAGTTAATWLEVYGKKDVWKLYQHDQRELESTSTGKDDKKNLKLILSMTKNAADTLAAKDQQSAPYVLDPSLRTDHTVKPGSVCPCSYPSRHAARAAASRTYLGHVDPRRINEYRWMESQVAFSRLYMAGHVRSDITAGSMLGDMVGEYVLVSRGRMTIPTGRGPA